MNLFARSNQGLNLTPGERAFLRLIELCVLAGLITAATAIVPLLANGVPDWQTVYHVALPAFCMAALGAFVKFYNAKGDKPLPDPTVVAGMLPVTPPPAPAPTPDPAPAPQS